METYLIKLTAHVRTYAFGGRLIPEKLGKKDVPEGVVAEAWEISDYRETSGRIINGEYTGLTLHDLVLEYPDELVGEGWRGPHFPLLIKFLDASKMLPVHLHADDATAREKHGEPHGKTEAWHTFGPDTLILEVQQTSDLGQFVMPFDLYGNRLGEEEWDANIEATLDELKTDYLPYPNHGLVLEDDANRRVLCC